jgi:hypothetical protein
VGIQLDVEKAAEGGESCEEPGEVIVHEKKKGVIDVSEGCGGGALAIIAGITGAEAVGGMLKELCFDWRKQLVEDQAGKDRGKGVTLRETFVLEEKVGGAIRVGEVAAIGGSICEIKVREQGMNLGIVFEGLVEGVTRKGVEHVGDVEGEKGKVAGKVGSKGMVNILVELGLGRMKEKVDTAADSNAELAFLKEESGEAVGIKCHDDSTG